MRPTFEQICIGLALRLAKRSTCKRLKVGTVIASDDYRQIFSWGYNGDASGLKHSCNGSKGKCGCIHSETNAAIGCKVDRKLFKYVFVTHLPCLLCCKLLINLGGVKRVYYKNEYRDKSSLKLFKQAKIKVIKL